MKSKFDFYEIVKVNSSKNALREINNSEGVIRGKAQNEETGRWGYGVSIYKDNGLIWHIMEEDLQFTGRKADPKDFEAGETVKVQVDPKTGEGSLPDQE